MGGSHERQAIPERHSGHVVLAAWNRRAARVCHRSPARRRLRAGAGASRACAGRLPPSLRVRGRSGAPFRPRPAKRRARARRCLASAKSDACSKSDSPARASSCQGRPPRPRHQQKGYGRTVSRSIQAGDQPIASVKRLFAASPHLEIQGSSNAQARSIRHPGTHADRDDSATGVHGLALGAVVVVRAPDGVPALQRSRPAPSGLSKQGERELMDARAREVAWPGWPDSVEDAMTREERLLTACAWCERIRVGEIWVSPEDAIRELRTFEWPEPPLFTHGACEHCLGFLIASRAPADDDALPSQAA
jgi:hypothetical protein